ncbi:hypothetical protein [Aquibacillus kalidii]|uniref:hypothetical protein n=1 Tax=Aquibacillus kalidii TaxID=2762597 RepID=UPI001F1AE860|nr:hypothetical protein [Aquibacillus kalidii]
MLKFPQIMSQAFHHTHLLDLRQISRIHFDHNLPFNVQDVVSTGMTLLGFVARFVLLRMAFVFVPKLIRLIITSFAAIKVVVKIQPKKSITI